MRLQQAIHQARLRRFLKPRLPLVSYEKATTAVMSHLLVSSAYDFEFKRVLFADSGARRILTIRIANEQEGTMRGSHVAIAPFTVTSTAGGGVLQPGPFAGIPAFSTRGAD